MSRTTDRPTAAKVPAPKGAAARPAVDEQGEPRPWRSAEDTKGWKVIARGQRRPGGAPAPLIRLTVALDAAQSEWLRREAERTGLGYDELMLKLLDDARALGHAPAPAGSESHRKP